MSTARRSVRTPKDERLEARVTVQLKALIQRAADLAGLSVTDFVTMSVKRAAEATIREHGVISLSLRDSLRFAEALTTPSEPNDQLRAAFARLDAEVTSCDEPTLQ